MYKFNGAEGEFLIGVPARDLTDAEVKAFDPDQKTIFDAHMKTANPIYAHQDDVKEDAPAEAKPAKKA